MARACNHALRLLPNPVSTPLPGSRRSGARCRALAVYAQLPAEDDAYPTEPLKKVQVTQSVRRSRRRGTGGARQSLVSVGTSRGGGDQWSSDFDLTMRQLHLDDLIEDGQRDADVLVHLLVQQIDEKFNLTVLSSSRRDQSGLPYLGDSDPSVIYVRPGEEVDLDSVIQETVRLTASAKSSCSEACEKSTVVWQYGSNRRKKSSSQRWSKLLDLKKTLNKAPK
ncbi:large ribosomal RNA subunit accumulation protein YCED homolog 2, chloroplastic-like isoform X2 [Panicum virgatum]|uniref:large ribosomal RNA subunit accumulation protein YCED homolog 2, chloroplastic-like isoform X2 n=1 Tax=Panicum virgatum TaxID=38727 RepID=UPI0019D5555D|nr:large ribosomal RNA subunit accumulation protein YCED homolog 2, chloroplastic-like isoform X2 [Panicum virgatum]